MIEVQHLSKSYGRVTAVDDISFRVERGEILGFLGPNGAGKTTTMRVLTGYMPPSEGKAIVAGYDVVEEVGVETIRRRSLDLTGHLIRLADAAGFEVTSQRDPARRGASVTIRMPGFEGVHRELAERQILCDFRPDVGLRLGPHFFNTEEELDFAVSEVEDIVSSKAHEQHQGTAARF